MLEGREVDLEKLLQQILENPSKNPEIARIRRSLLKHDMLPESGDSDLESINNEMHHDDSSSDEGIGRALQKKKS